MISLNRQMVSISINNSNYTQVNIDGYIYDLPLQIDTVIHLSSFIVFHGIPHDIEFPSIYCYKEKTQEIIWKMKDVISVFAEIPENKSENDFINKEHYNKYMNQFLKKSIVAAYIGEFRKLIDVTTGQILSSMEVR